MGWVLCVDEDLDQVLVSSISASESFEVQAAYRLVVVISTEISESEGQDVCGQDFFRRAGEGFG